MHRILLSETALPQKAMLRRRRFGRPSASTSVAVSDSAQQKERSSSCRLRQPPTMPTIAAKDGTEIFYKDWGPKDAQPIVFHHGWPLSSDDWDAQMLFFVGKGYRVVAHDRRGHGRSASSAQQYRWIRDRYPELFARIREHVARFSEEIFIRRIRDIAAEQGPA
mgnify:CR=1 FL=1